MSATASRLVALTRGFCADQIEDGITTRFTEAEVVEAINLAKHDLFGRRPDAFSTLAVLTEEPADIESARTSLTFVQGNTSVVLGELGSSLGADTLDKGSISLSIRTTLTDTEILAFGNVITGYYIRVYLEDGLLKVDAVDGIESVTVETTMLYSDNNWRTFTVEADGSYLILTDHNGNEFATAYTGNLIPGSDQAFLGYSDLSGTNVFFAGSMADLVISNNADTELCNYAMDDGSGYVLADSVGAVNADIAESGEEVAWTTDDQLEIAGWAETPLCLKASAVLMLQRSKDSHYRKAVDVNEERYLRSI